MSRTQIQRIYITGDGNVVGDNNQVTVINKQYFIGEYERLRDAYIEPWPAFERVDLEYFAGREWLSAAVDAFLRDHDRGYFILEAEAGLGKTTFLAWLVQQRGYIHHFVELAPGLDGVGVGLKNLAAQLTLACHLDAYEAEGVLPGAAARPDYLLRLLKQASEQRQQGQKIVLVIDALDEAGTPPGQNALGLPKVLPDDATVLLTSDHGGHDRIHGTDEPEDMTVPWMIAGPHIRRGYEIQAPVSLLDIAPTMARVLEIIPDSDWEGRCVEEVFA